MKYIIHFIFVCASILSSTVFANHSQQDFRTLYTKWVTSQSMSFDEQQTLVNSLKNYSLFPYVEMQFIQNNISIVSPQLVVQFIKNNSDFPLAASLSQSYLAELTRRQDWQTIRTFPRDNSIASACRYQYALFQLGETQKAFEPVQELWLTGKELPAACDQLLASWDSAGYKTPELILLRIESAIKLNNIKLARYLVNQLPDNYQLTKTNLLGLFDNPKNLLDFSRTTTSNELTKSVVMTFFPRLVKTDANLAQLALPALVKQQNLTREETISLEYAIANAFFSDSASEDNKRWRDNFILENHQTSLVEKRIRLSIEENNPKDIAYWLGQLNPQDQLKEEWQYWQARMLWENNKISEAKAIFETLKKNRGFYGMVSAQTLGYPYSLSNQSKKVTPSELSLLKEKYDNANFIKRINELRYLGMLKESNREWRYYLNNVTTQTEYLDLVKYANHRDWLDLSIQATISGKLWDNWTDRLPIIFQNLYTDALKDKDISLSYALAITRQESAFDSTAQSPVGAAGLMQLMPATAKDTAKKVNAISYCCSEQLFEPKLNIQLGTYYLNSIYLQNDNNRILASAAYNAGPSRLKRWLKKSNNSLDVIAFIESIPFTETRNYVKNILVYDYVYQTILNEKADGIFQKHELNRQY